jgi:phasin family protein
MSAKTQKTTKTAAEGDVTQLAQRSVDQAQAAVERAGEFAHDNLQLFDAASSAFKSGMAELQLKMIEIVQANLNAQFGHVRKLLDVRQPQDAFALQQSFVRDQFAAFGRQSQEIGELSVQFARETTKPFQDSWMRSLGEFSRNFAR